MNNQEFKVRPEFVFVNSDKPVSFAFSIRTSKCSGTCNNISDPYAKLCVADVVKNLNAKAFNLISRTNETRHKWHKTCKCKCRQDASVCNIKQCWNKDNCRRECKKLIDKGVYDEEFIWNTINCECERDKLCDIGEYLDYENGKCRKRFVDKLVEEYTETNNEVKLSKKTLAENEYKYKCSFCTLYICYF